MSGKPAFWLRCEKKEFERRSALTPTTAKKLLDAGFEIFVERDEQRIFEDAEYEASVISHLLLTIFPIFSAVWAASWLITIPGQVHQRRSRLSD
jgi:alanine dehydrogenase